MLTNSVMVIHDIRAMNDDLLKLQVEILRDELKSIVATEAWSASLFLGAIALLSKQILDWEGQIPPIHPHALIFILPALIGLAAFIFLRVVNFYTFRIRNRLFDLTKLASEPRKFTFGCVGWLMAVMPLSLGYVASWYLAVEKPDVQAFFPVFTLASIVYCDCFWNYLSLYKT